MHIQCVAFAAPRRQALVRPPAPNAMAAPGIGGAFLVTPEPERLVTWLNDRFGLGLEAGDDGGYAVFDSDAGASVLSVMRARAGTPMPPASDVAPEPYGRQAMMVNLRLPDLDACLERLAAGSDAVAGPVEHAGLGRFAWTQTPDGHDLELWEPAA